MKIKCVATDTELLSMIVGNDLKAFEDLMGKLTVHLQARQPEVMKNLSMIAMQYVALGIMNQAESENEFWNKTSDGVKKMVLEAIGYGDEELNEYGEEKISDEKPNGIL